MQPATQRFGRPTVYIKIPGLLRLCPHKCRWIQFFSSLKANDGRVKAHNLFLFHISSFPVKKVDAEHSLGLLKRTNCTFDVFSWTSMGVPHRYLPPLFVVGNIRPSLCNIITANFVWWGPSLAGRGLRELASDFLPLSSSAHLAVILQRSSGLRSRLLFLAVGCLVRVRHGVRSFIVGFWRSNAGHLVSSSHF